MADLSKLSPTFKEFFQAMGYSLSEIGSSLWTDEAVDGYIGDMLEWSSVGKPPLRGVGAWIPSSGPLLTVSGRQQVVITPEVAFWMSESGEEVGAMVDALRLPEIANLLPDPKWVKLGVAVAAVIAILVIVR